MPFALRIVNAICIKGPCYGVANSIDLTDRHTHRRGFDAGFEDASTAVKNFGLDLLDLHGHENGAAAGRPDVAKYESL